MRWGYVGWMDLDLSLYTGHRCWHVCRIGTNVSRTRVKYQTQLSRECQRDDLSITAILSTILFDEGKDDNRGTTLLTVAMFQDFGASQSEWPAIWRL